jgi:hypothetical protein
MRHICQNTVVVHCQKWCNSCVRARSFLFLLAIVAAECSKMVQDGTIGENRLGTQNPPTMLRDQDTPPLGIMRGSSPLRSIAGPKRRAPYNAFLFCHLPSTPIGIQRDKSLADIFGYLGTFPARAHQCDGPGKVYRWHTVRLVSGVCSSP